jgi:hypothetical protein
MQRDPRPLASGKAVAILIAALALFWLFLAPLIHSQVQDSLCVPSAPFKKPHKRKEIR